MGTEKRKGRISSSFIPWKGDDCNNSVRSILNHFELQDVNEFPIAYNIAWYEQKAVIVLLALLSLGVKHIHLGPTLPAFLSPNVAKVLVENFGIGGITSVEEDMNKFGL